MWSQLVSYALWGFIWLTRSSWVLSRPVDGMMTSCHFALPHPEEGIGNSGSWPSRALQGEVLVFLLVNMTIFMILLHPCSLGFRKDGLLLLFSFSLTVQFP